MGHFDANPFPYSCLDLIWSTSCTKYIDEGQVQDGFHSHRGAKLLDLCIVINQYPNQTLNTVVVIAGFNDKRSKKKFSKSIGNSSFSSLLLNLAQIN